MNSNSLAVVDGGKPDAAAQLKVLEQVVVQGDLSKMTTADRLAYYRNVCDSLGLNPFTQPFHYLSLNGKLTLYAKKDCTDQLRKIHRVSVTVVSREKIDDLYVVTARASLPDGRSDEEIGVVSVMGLKGEALANAMMKATTKAKRRVTLSVVGLGWLDESDTDNIPGALPITVETAHGEVNLVTGEIAPTATPKAGSVREAAMETLRELLRVLASSEIKLKGSELGLGLTAVRDAMRAQGCKHLPDLLLESISEPKLRAAIAEVTALINQEDQADAGHSELDAGLDAAVSAEPDPFAE